MRLLSKSEVQQSQATQKKLEIEEGLKLARKVDSLRTTVAEEEQRLRKYKTETVNEVTKEIQSLVLQRDILLAEVDVAKRERDSLRIPLDAEWEKVNREKRLLEDVMPDVQIAFESIEHEKQNIANAYKTVTHELERAKDLRIQAEKDAVVSAENRKYAEKALKDAQTIRHDAVQIARATEQQLSSREANVATRERNADMRDKAQDAREIELNARETLINDRYQTLLRDEKRLLRTH